MLDRIQSPEPSGRIEDSRRATPGEGAERFEARRGLDTRSTGHSAETGADSEAGTGWVKRTCTRGGGSSVARARTRCRRDRYASLLWEHRSWSVPSCSVNGQPKCGEGIRCEYFEMSVCLMLKRSTR